MTEIVAQNYNWIYQNHLLNESAKIQTKSVKDIFFKRMTAKKTQKMSLPRSISLGEILID